MLDHTTTKLLVKSILENPTPQSRNWSLQGLGMLRLYLSTELRLHIWDSRYAVENASRIHNHPWDFVSYVVAGYVRQYRYVRSHDLSIGTNHLCSVLKCGPGGACERTRPTATHLCRLPEEMYGETFTYAQRADEIHESLPGDGTVTLVTRHFTREDRDHAQIFWPKGEEWVSAEPRPASDREVHEMTSKALEKWF
jgi:hypothetical protein